MSFAFGFNSPIWYAFRKLSKAIPNAVPGVGKLSPNVLSRQPEVSQKTTGLLTGFGVAAPKRNQTVLDQLLKLLLSTLSFFFSILRRFIPSSIWNFLVRASHHYAQFMSSDIYQVFVMPPWLAFYELALRGYYPRLPSLFKIAFKLHQRGFLTIGTIMWLASSLPTDFLGPLGALGGAAMKTTTAMAGGAAVVGNALVGTAAGLAGDTAKNVTQSIKLLKPGVVPTDLAHVLPGGQGIAGRATSIATAGMNGAAGLAGGATQAVAGGLSIVKNGQTAVAENIAHLVSGDHAIAPEPVIPDIAKDAIGATHTAVIEHATKFANALESANPLHANLMSKVSWKPQACVTFIAHSIDRLTC
jgi:hypothetical protein